MSVVRETTIAAPRGTQRVSWGAIFAGVVVALGVHVIMGVLGVAIGASFIDPMYQENPMDGVATGAGIYSVITVVVSMLVGGFTAGALASIQTPLDRTLHGLSTWSVATLLVVLLLTTGLGRLIGGTMNIVGSGLQQVGGAAAAAVAAAPIADRVGQRVEDGDIDLGGLRQEARGLLRDAGIRPESVERQVAQVRDEAGRTVERSARDPQAADEEFQRVFDRIEQSDGETIGQADRSALVNLLVQRTDMSRAEAEQTVANWDRSYTQTRQEARTRFEETRASAEQTARELGQQSADAVAKAAWWSFIVLVLGALAAVIGANMGSGRNRVAAHHDVHHDVRH